MRARTVLGLLVMLGGWVAGAARGQAEGPGVAMGRPRMIAASQSPPATVQQPSLTSHPAPNPGPLVPPLPPGTEAPTPAPPPPQPPAVLPAAPLPAGGASLSMEVVGPAETRPGGAVRARLLVRNLGALTLTGARVAVALPPGASLVGADPAPVERSNERLAWEVGALDAGASRELVVDLKPNQAGEIQLRPEVRFAATVTLRAAAGQPPLSVVVNGPDRAKVGSPVTYRIKVSNQTREPLRRATLRCDLGAGLEHPQGREIWAELGDLPPGEVRTEELTVQAARPGQQAATLTVAVDGGHKVSARTALLVGEPAGEPKLMMRLDGPLQGHVGQVLSYRIELSNDGRGDAPAGRLSQLLPDGMEFVSAGDGGRFTPATRSIDWALPALAPGQGHSVTFQVRGRGAGDWAMTASARPVGAQESSAFRAVRLAAVPQALVLELTMSDSHLTAGAEAVALLRVYNPGPAQARNVRLAVVLPDGLTPVRADGPTRGRAQGGVVYEPVAVVPARSEAIFRVRVRADRPCSGWLRASVLAAGMERPAQQEAAVEVKGR